MSTTTDKHDRFLKIVLAGMVTPLMLAFILICLPFYALGLLFNWLFNLELL